METRRFRRLLSLFLCAVMLFQPVLATAEGITDAEQPAESTARATLRIVEQPEDVTVAAGEKAEFTVVASGDGLTYQWQSRSNSTTSWSKLSGKTAATLSIVTTKYLDGYEYRCQVTDADGSKVLTDPVKLTIVAEGTAVAVKITSHPANKTVKEGSSAKFTVSATGTGLTYQWQYSSNSGSTWANASSTGSTTATLTVSGVMSRDGFLYRCIVKDSSGNTATSQSAKLTVTADDTSDDPALTFAITLQPVAQSVTAGMNVKFTVTATGTGLTYQWQYSANGGSTWGKTSSTGSTTATLSVSAVNARNGYLYRCVVTDASGATLTSKAVKLTVTAAETSAIKITSHPAAKTATVGTTAKFTVAATGTGLTYQWQYSANGGSTWGKTSSTGSTTATLSVSAVNARNGYLYRCVITDSNGNKVTSNSAKLTVTAASAIKITAHPAAKTVTAGTKVKFTVTATGTGLTYQWQYSANGGSTWGKTSSTGSTTATLSVSAVNARNGYLYRCVITDSNGNKVTSNSAKLTVTAAETSTIKITSQPTAQTASVGATVKFTVTATGTGLTYQWQYSANNGTSWGNASSAGCKTATLTVDAVMARDGYLYRCVIKDGSGASVTSSAVKLTVDEARTPLNITSHPAAKTVTEGATAAFTVKATGDSLTYQWQYSANGGSTWARTSSAGSTTTTLTVDAVNARNGYLYRCAVTDTYGTTKYSNAAKLTVEPAPEKVTITRQPDSMTVPEGMTVTFEVEATGDSLTYQWQYSANGGSTWAKASSTGSTTAMISVPATMARDGYLYRCVVTDRYGYTAASIGARLTVYKALTITSHPQSVTATVGETVTFSVTATGDDLTYQWYAFHEDWMILTGKTSSILTVKVENTVTGYYRCVVTDKYGASLTSEYAQLTAQEPDPTVPNIPSAPTANLTSNNGIKVTWQAVSGAEQYVVYRSNSKTGNYSRLGQTTNTFMTDNNVVEGVTYYYKVAATNDAGESAMSANSNGVMVPITDTEPDAPTGVTVSVVSGNGIMVTWQAVPGATQYVVYRSTSTATSSFTIETTTAQTSWIDTGVSAGTTYYYKVAAVNEIGEGEMSSTSNGIMVPVQAQPVYSGSFGKSVYTMTVGETLRLSGNVSVTNGVIDRVTVKVKGYQPDGANGENRYATKTFNSVTSVSLGSYSAFTLDGTDEPFCVPGTYTLTLWAGDDEGHFNATTLDEATVIVYAAGCNLDLSASSVSFSKSSGSKSITVTHDGSYSVKITNPDAKSDGYDWEWLTYTKSGNTLTLTAEPNYGTQKRTCYVTVTCSCGETIQLTVTQEYGYSAPSLSATIGEPSNANAITLTEGYQYGPLVPTDNLWLFVVPSNARRVNVQFGWGGSVDSDITTTTSQVDAHQNIPAGTAAGLYTVTITLSNSNLKDDGYAQRKVMKFKVNVIGGSTGNGPGRLLSNTSNASLKWNKHGVYDYGKYGSGYTCHDVSDCPEGTSLYAPYDGYYTAYYVYYTKNGVNYLISYGNYIVFEAANEDVTMVFAHLSKVNGYSGSYISNSETISSSECSSEKTVCMVNRTYVTKGTKLGETGNTGKSFGAHLHVEVYDTSTGSKKRLVPCAYFNENRIVYTSTSSSSNDPAIN